MGHLRALILVSAILITLISTSAQATRPDLLGDDSIDAKQSAFEVEVVPEQEPSIAVCLERPASSCRCSAAVLLTGRELGWAQIPTPQVWFGDKRGYYASVSDSEADRQWLIDGVGYLQFVSGEVHREERRAAYD